MKKSLILVLCPVLLFVLFALPASAETIRCAICGMKSDLESKFTSKIDQGNKTLYFCDIGDLLTYVNEKKPENITAQVRDFMTNEWLDAQKALYVRSKKFRTPMGWEIAAFKNRDEAGAYADVMDFEEALEAVR